MAKKRVASKKQAAGKRRPGRRPSVPGQLSAQELVMQRAASLYISGEHLTVEAIARESVSRATISKLFKGEGKKPTIKVIEDSIIAYVLGKTRATIFQSLKSQSRLVAASPLDLLINIFSAVLEVFDRNAMGMFVAHRLTNIQDDQALTLTLSRVDELLLASLEMGQLNEEAGRDLVKLRLMLFGILRGLLMLLPAGSAADGEADGLARAARAPKPVKARRARVEAVTAQDVEIEFLRVIQLHVSDDWKEHVERYVEAARKA